ncbi:uncharacterized protein LOC107723140 [Sinocyclocheilus rhinocerous]|uniref:uncharacterized protein LOC107723140 n=1 Tax=Sinocyclocheilus rhinocerous TaxID=307959 RepID=UPI0007B85F0B|nr:PREDICTED: uncharacterized protein LOC107723140 [Sinocyclocheilus rhinocerous]
MPQANCMKCAKKIPLQLLPLHVEDCEETSTETETDVTIIEEKDCAEFDQPIEQSRGSEEKSQETETDVTIIEEKDCAEFDQPIEQSRGSEEKSQLNKAELDEAERTRLIDLCLFWDLPVPSPTNQEWLFQQLLTHAVLGRVKKQIKDLRRGMKDTGIWPLISQRQDVHRVLFPRESTEVIDSQTVLQKITWPKLTEDDDDDEGDITIEKLTLISGYMRTFIEEASPAILSDLTRFWVGWEIPEENLVLEVVTAEYPVAHTCFNTLCLPCHYQNYTTFKKDMLMCLKSVSSGFGLV